jgi:hypothetical protein|tara:strand:+ start:501 stop:1022 length:522 start_codon:yes stop_codon:yes gene_type:complete
MANNRFNKQVTPKGYQKGGSVKQSPMGSSSTKGNILRGKLKSQKELKKITDSKKYKDASYGEKNKMLNVATMKKGGRVGKMGGGMMKRPMYKDGSLKPVDKEKNPGLSKLPTEVRNKMGFMKKGGRVGKKFGGGADSGRIGQLKSDLKTAKNTTEKRTALKKADKDRNKFKVK